MINEKNVPELRFPEYNEKWEEKKLGEIVDFSKGKLLGKKDLVENDGFPCILYGELYTKYGPIINSVISRTNVDKDKLKKGEKNQILIPSSGETTEDIATASALNINGDVYIGGDLNILTPKEKDGRFISLSLNGVNKWNIAKFAQGKTVVHLYNNDLRKLNINLPTKIEEQQKIGVFFSKLDRQIELEEQKLAKLEEQKKGYMQKIFSQKLRFKDENGGEYPEWKSKKLKDIANVYQPQNLSQNNFQKKGYPVYGANGVIGYYKDFNHSNMEIAVACRGNTCGRVNLTEPKSWITSNAMVVNIIDKMEIEFYFLYQYLRIINYSNVISGSGQPQITRKNMNSVELLVPNYIEQQKIGNLFRRFDDFIEKQSHKIELLKERKKGFLQKMFV
ncbi:restriction endonuclease subunit S [Staphylococcus warneri]|uniref:restriction endonuclease subunit S n=1 Tax=Staphylococcus warneri TaxID=1292 RepID=UPI000F53B55E|nr:restriction endonuclease subunit S [Staphylococcus warneri]RQN01090.1 restriction endonuclease subunit S [Staphylococcus warneri]